MSAVVAAARPARAGRLVLPALALGCAAASVAVAFAIDAPTTYAATSPLAAAADVAAGLGLVVAGAGAWLARSGGSVGPVVALLGLAWFAPDWVGWDSGWPLVRSLGMVAAPFLLALLVHLTAAFPSGRVAAGPARLAVALVYAAAGVVAIGRALTRDPFLDPNCWSNCTDNAFLVFEARGTALALDAFWLRFSVAAGLLLAFAAVWRLAAASRAGRGVLVAVLAPVVLAAAADVAYAVALLADPGEVPESAVFRAVFFARALALACLSGGVAWSVARARRRRGAISRLVADLGTAPTPGSLRTALARSLGDERLEVAYWLPASGRYVDGAGRAIAPLGSDERAATPIVRGGEPVALVLHDRALAGGRELESEIGAAARLAVDNERLQAEVRAQLEELRISRARIVETGDAARRRLERDLHDGAQQRLLALSYDLRVARAQAEAGGDMDVATLLAAAADEARAALAELRDLAHGIYPAILTEAGLGPALQTLADAAPLPVELGDVPAERFPAPVETAAYLAVADAIGDAAARGAGHVAVKVVRAEMQLLLEIDDDGSERSTEPIHVTDRVGALGGSLRLESNTLRAELPCA